MAKNVLFIVAPNNFRDEELFETKTELEGAGIKTAVASKGVKEAKGSLGGKVKVDFDISNAKAENFDAVVFVGGPGAIDYIEDKDALRIAKEFSKSNKVVSAICVAPVILAKAGILKGKK